MFSTAMGITVGKDILTLAVAGLRFSVEIVASSEYLVWSKTYEIGTQIVSLSLKDRAMEGFIEYSINKIL